MRSCRFLAPVGLVGLLLFAGCSSGATSKPGDPCRSDADCGDDYCVGGLCAECRSRTDCAAGQVCLGGRCLQDCEQQDRCEYGGDCCPGDYVCEDRTCLPPCSGTRCGHRLEWCCDAGEVCVQDRCQLDCGGNQLCGEHLDTCCGAGQICYGSQCLEPGPECNRQADCPPGQVCERDLGRCLDEQVIGDCQYIPPVGQFNPQRDCRWTPPADHATPVRNDVVMTPVVANLTDDNGDGRTDRFDTPEIAFISYDREGDGCCNVPGTLRVVSGQCQPDGGMHTIFSSAQPVLDNSGGLAVGDLDGDGVPEIVAMTMVDVGGNLRPQGTVAFKRTSPDGASWEVLWHNQQYPAWNTHTRGGSQPSIANIDSAGAPEVIIGNVVLDGLGGALRWDGLQTVGPAAGIGNNAFLGPVSAVADIDLDGYQEVLAGNTCYEHDGTEKWTYTYTSQNSPCGGDLPCDGYNAVGNFDTDDEGEVVIVRQGEVFVINHDGSLLGQVAIPVDDCQNNESGPPTVADFDGDGRPEVGTAAGDYYVIVDLDCLGALTQDGCSNRPGVLWYVPNEDCSSRVTASSVFDFDGDGRAEAVYADETSFRIFDGSSGQELYRDGSHGSHTRLEEVVIADVDNDGNAEVVVAENATKSATPGIVVWGDVLDNWVFTRRIWNQHSYHVSNISEDGAVPTYEEPNWLAPWQMNNFRQNVQGEGLFWAPDLVVVNLLAVCDPGPALYVSCDVVNQGSRMVAAGAPVTIYVNDQPVQTLTTTQALLPGQLERLVYSWPVPLELQNVPLEVRVGADDFGDGSGRDNECHEDNNTATVGNLVCGVVN